MFNARLAGGHLYGKQLFTWLSLVVSFMASLVLSFFPLDVLDGIWDLIESVSEGVLTYSFKKSFKIFFAPYLARSALEVCSRNQITAFISNGYLVNFPFFDGDLPCSTSYDVYISQFARVSSQVTDLKHVIKF